jgi:chromosome segregation protein
MHLSAIRLRGFKSFVDPVEVRLEPGVAVVVGPNGSGKSNVADGIVWAAGSLTPSELRAEKPDDVLFAGAAGRDPADFCEVELLFDNTAGDGPIDYSELSIVRRLHRGGEGQYLVNRTAVRRIDLVELLSDLGLGGGMHSIIGQGKVEEILGSKPEERRALVEEAAGLGKFKRRRHRAELKLARVAIQVERARDLEAEVKSRLRPLALQATAAERAEKLAAQIASVRARVAELDLAAIAERRAEAEQRRQAATLARRAADEKLEALLAERTRAEEELADAAGRREAATASLYRFRSMGERAALRREAALELLARLRAELAEALQAPVEDGATAALEAAVRAAASTARAAYAEREEAALRARQVAAALVPHERAADAEAAARLEALLTERARVEAELAQAAGAREASAAALSRLRGAGERIAVRRESAAALAAELQAELAEAEAAATGAGPSPQELERAATEAAAAARAAARERDELAERARLGRERLAALETTLAEREGIPPAARALAEEGETLALSLLDVVAGTERAIAAALGPRASALVAPDAAAALALVERAATAGLGSIRVLIGRDPAELVAELPVVAKDELLGSKRAAVTPEGYGYDPERGELWFAGEAAEAVLIGRDPAELVAELAVVAKDELLGSKRAAVTPEGYGYDPERGELWFAGEAAEAVLIELDARRRALAEETAELERRAADAIKTASAAEAWAYESETAFAAVAHLVARPVRDPKALAALSVRAERLDEALAAAAAHAARVADAVEKRLRSAGAADAGDDLRRLAIAEAELRQAAARAVELRTDAERELERLGGEALPAASGDPAALRVELERAREALAAAERAAAEAEAEARSTQAELAEAAPVRRVAVPPQTLELLGAQAERLDDALQAVAAATARYEAPLRARVDAGGIRTGALAEELRTLGAAEVELRREHSGAGERAGAIDVELARIEADAEEAQRRLEAAAAQPCEGDDRDELAAKLERDERRLEALGRVNPLAKEEYEAEKERLEELSVQRTDLEQSLAELEKLRAELTETVERRFAETFETVSGNFEDIATTLFPGGSGRLILTEGGEDEEATEPGVEIELRPAGKKITTLSLLSGGEKSLGAIAFLFALFLSHPCPFYLLDEVEAALDDTNIGRFVELLRRYSDRAQFIVITHQKRTMEAADVLYGVTMGGDGISQVVSRKLPRDEAAAVA